MGIFFSSETSFRFSCLCNSVDQKVATMKVHKTLLILSIIEFIILFTYGLVAALALGSNKHFFIPELFAPQLGFAIFLLLVPITGFIAIGKGSSEHAFWHALFSASGIAVAATAAILAAYGSAIGKALQEYYLKYDTRESIWDVWSSYEHWIIGAPVICMVCAIATVILLPFSYFTVVNAHNKYDITNQRVAEE